MDKLVLILFIVILSQKNLFCSDIIQTQIKGKDVNNMSVLNVTKNNFAQIKNSEKTVLLDFYADWCAPCRMVSPLIDEIAKENPQYLVGKINVDSEPELAQAFRVMSIPMLAVMKNGRIVNQAVGARPKSEILKMLNS